MVLSWYITYQNNTQWKLINFVKLVEPINSYLYFDNEYYTKTNTLKILAS